MLRENAARINDQSVVFNAASLDENLGKLWGKATAEERRKILLGMLDAVYLDMRQGMGVVGLLPKPAFRPLFESIETKEYADLRILNRKPSPDSNSGEDGLLWWRRGRVELGLKHGIMTSLLIQVNQPKLIDETLNSINAMIFPCLKAIATKTLKRSSLLQGHKLHQPCLRCLRNKTN